MSLMTIGYYGDSMTCFRRYTGAAANTHTSRNRGASCSGSGISSAANTYTNWMSLATWLSFTRYFFRRSNCTDNATDGVANKMFPRPSILLDGGLYYGNDVQSTIIDNLQRHSSERQTLGCNRRCRRRRVFSAGLYARMLQASRFAFRFGQSITSLT